LILLFSDLEIWVPSDEEEIEGEQNQEGSSRRKEIRKQKNTEDAGAAGDKVSLLLFTSFFCAVL